MANNIQVTIYTPQDLNHSSYMQAGLFELEKKGFLKVKIAYNTKKRFGRVSTENGSLEFSNHPQPKTSYYLLEDLDRQKEIFFAADLYDISHFFSSYALENCDYIFKRNFESKHIHTLNNRYKAKIYPAGLTFGCQTDIRKKWTLFKIAHFISISKLRLKFDRNILQRIRNVIKHTSEHYRYVTHGRSLEGFRGYHSDVQLRVFYQVRCFPRIEEPDVKIIHEERSTLIKVLKKRLGDKFLGGLVPSEVSKNYYPECLTNLPTDPVSYLNLIKSSAICIYTKGLQNSPARKLSEYLSQGKCIVAEPFSTELNVPLEHGKHLMFYNSPEECAEICEELLNNPKKVKELSDNARQYYEDFVDPEINVKRMIETMLENE